jgi:hypothetical protein
MHKHRRTRWALGALAAVLAFGIFAVAGWAGDPQFDEITASLAPDPVTGGGDVLYTATYPYTGKGTLTRAEIRITFPADWTYAGPADPDVCQTTGPTTLTCVRATTRAGDPPVIQAVRFTTKAVDSDQLRTVNSIFTFREQATQGDQGRIDFVSAPDAEVHVVPVSNDHVSKCAAKNGETVSTPGAVTATDAMKITMAIPANAAALCSPVSALELPPGDPSVDACPEGIVCTTETAVVSGPLFTPANPIKLTLEIFGKVKSWYKNGQLPALAECTGPPGTANPDPCISGRPANLAKGQRWTFLWSGDDPSYGGG